MNPEHNFEQPKSYQIRVRGHLNPHWAEWLDGLAITYEKHGITVLTGNIADQPQLHGLLLKIRDLGLSLVSVAEINNGQSQKPAALHESNCHEKKIAIGKEIQFRSKILKENCPILISLPGDYHESREKYPVLYHLDGYEHLFQLAAGTIRYLSEWEKLIPPLILVAISNTDRDRDLFPTQTTLPTGEIIGGGADKFLKFIETELVPYFDENYRTLSNRILYGTSNSGLTAIYSLLNRSPIFDAFVASSPTLSWDGNFIFHKAGEAFKSWQPTQKFLYMICGKEDLGNVHQENLDFAALLANQAPPSLTWGFDVSDEDRHCPYRSLHDGLMMLFAEWGYAGKRVE